MPSVTDKTRARFGKLLNQGKEILAAKHEILGIGFLDGAAYASWRVQAEAALETLGKDSVYVRSFRRAGNSARSETIIIQIGVIEGVLEASGQRDDAEETIQREPTMATKKTGIFISHATANEPITGDFVSMILEQGIGISPKDIFFSSSSDQGVPTGHNFIGHIKQRVQKCAVLIAWITDDFLKSPFCLCELGAAWAHLPEGSFIPIVQFPSFGKVPSPINSVQGLLMTSASYNTSMNKLRDDLNQLLALTPHSTDRWERHRNAFRSKYI